MASIKLSVTHRGRLKAKYGAAGLAAIDAAVAKWIARDKTRGLATVHVEVDVAASLQPFGVQALSGAVTAVKLKKIVDKLWTKLEPDYLVLLGSDEIVPLFDVANPTLDADGDTDAKVPTDNPYACTKNFAAGDRSTYLVPDRVVGRIPDQPGASEPSTLLAALATATSWKSKKRSAYSSDLLACCDAWKGAGLASAKQIGRAASRLQVSPPEDETTKRINGRRKAMLQMIKAHGAELDARFYGQKGGNYPVLLNSTALVNNTRAGAVVGAMCCFGAALFDPADAAAALPGAPPIPLVYLRQGAFGFGGSTTTAWVGASEMMCADWIVTGFLKSVLAGASLGRAMLESKQDFVEWLQKQGTSPDLADEKTLIQFVLLGDPSLHPVVAAAMAGTPGPAALGAAVPATPLALAAPTAAGVAAARRVRRVYRTEVGSRLRESLPDRRRIATPKKVESSAPAAAAKEARKMVAPATAAVPGAAPAAAGPVSAKPKKAYRDFEFDFSKPKVERVTRGTGGPVAAMASRVVAAALGAPPTARQTELEYYWSARRKVGPVPEICVIQVTTDENGELLKRRVLVSS